MLFNKSSDYVRQRPRKLNQWVLFVCAIVAFKILQPFFIASVKSIVLSKNLIVHIMGL